MKFPSPEGKKIIGKSLSIHKNQLIEETDKKGEACGPERKGGAWTAGVLLPGAWCALPGGGAQGEGSRPPDPPRPAALLALSKATGPDSLIGASMFTAQIFRCSFPCSGLCEAVSVYLS